MIEKFKVSAVGLSIVISLAIMVPYACFGIDVYISRLERQVCWNWREMPLEWLTDFMLFFGILRVILILSAVLLPALCIPFVHGKIRQYVSTRFCFTLMGSSFFCLITMFILTLSWFLTLYGYCNS